MEHEIILDLLPLYRDGVCSAASRVAVEAHLETCAACRKALADMDAPLPEAEQKAADDAAAMKRISRGWKKGKRRAWICGIVIGVAACVAVAGGAWFLNTWTCIPMDSQECSVQVYQLENGDVGVHWSFFNATWSALTFEEREDGKHWRVERPILWVTVFNFDNKTYNSTRDALFRLENEDETVYLDLGEESILLIQDGQPAPDIPLATPEQAARWEDIPAVSEK